MRASDSSTAAIPPVFEAYATVVLPYGRGGIIGGSMLGLGRALGARAAGPSARTLRAGLRSHRGARRGAPDRDPGGAPEELKRPIRRRIFRRD